MQNKKNCMCLCKLESGWDEQKQHLYVPCSLYIPQSCCRTLKHSGNSHFSIQWGFSTVVCDLCCVNKNNETKSLQYALDYTHQHVPEFPHHFCDFPGYTNSCPRCICQKDNMISDKGNFYWWVLLYTCRGVGHAWQYNPFSSVVLIDCSGWWSSYLAANWHELVHFCHISSVIILTLSITQWLSSFIHMH